MWRIKNWSIKQQIIFTHKPNLTKNISIEILIPLELNLDCLIKSIALEIIQFENRHTKNINWTFLHFQFINIPI